MKLEVSERARETGARQVGDTELEMDRLLEEVILMRQSACTVEGMQHVDSPSSSLANDWSSGPEMKLQVPVVRDLCHMLVGIISDLQAIVDVEFQDSKRLERAALIESGAGAIIARRGGRDIVLLLQKLRADLDSSIHVQGQQRSLNKSREIELEELRQHSERLCAQLTALNGSSSISPFSAGSPLRRWQGSALRRRRRG